MFSYTGEIHSFFLSFFRVRTIQLNSTTRMIHKTSSGKLKPRQRTSIKIYDKILFSAFLQIRKE